MDLQNPLVLKALACLKRINLKNTYVDNSYRESDLPKWYFVENSKSPVINEQSTCAWPLWHVGPVVVPGPLMPYGYKYDRTSLTSGTLCSIPNLSCRNTILHPLPCHPPHTMPTPWLWAPSKHYLLSSWYSCLCHGCRVLESQCIAIGVGKIPRSIVEFGV